KALPADRSTGMLARCYALVGEIKQAEVLLREAVTAQTSNPATLRLAADFYASQGRPDEARPLLAKLVDPKTGASPAHLAWANRTRAAFLLRTGHLADRDQALGLVEQSLKNDPDSIEDRGLKATILALRPSRRDEAITLLEQLRDANRLDAHRRFLLAQLYLVDRRDEAKYQAEMGTILELKARAPRHLAPFINHLIERNQPDQADRWLAELKKTEPRALGTLELEARLLDLQKRQPELRALLEARGRQFPDQIGVVADLLNRFGFAPEAEAAYRAFIARDPKQPERVLALATFLAGQGRTAESIRIFDQARATCRPELVALTAVALYDAPSVTEDQRRQVEAWLSAAIQQRPEAWGLSA